MGNRLNEPRFSSSYRHPCPGTVSPSLKVVAHKSACRQPSFPAGRSFSRLEVLASHETPHPPPTQLGASEKAPKSIHDSHLTNSALKKYICWDKYILNSLLLFCSFKYIYFLNIFLNGCAEVIMLASCKVMY